MTLIDGTKKTLVGFRETFIENIRVLLFVAGLDEEMLSKIHYCPTH